MVHGIGEDKKGPESSEALEKPLDGACMETVGVDADRKETPKVCREQGGGQMETSGKRSFLYVSELRGCMRY